MRLLKLFTLTLICGGFLVSCKPDTIKPKDAPVGASFEVDDPLGHEVPLPCSDENQFLLVAADNPNPDALWGSVEMNNNADWMHIKIQGALPIAEAAVWHGGENAPAPVIGADKLMTEFQVHETYDPPKSITSFKIALENVEECNHLVVWAKLVFADDFGNIFFSQEAIALGDIDPTTGSQFINYCNAMQYCPNEDGSPSCEKWRNASNPCGVAAPPVVCDEAVKDIKFKIISTSGISGDVDVVVYDGTDPSRVFKSSRKKIGESITIKKSKADKNGGDPWGGKISIKIGNDDPIVFDPRCAYDNMGSTKFSPTGATSVKILSYTDLAGVKACNKNKTTGSSKKSKNSGSTSNTSGSPSSKTGSWSNHSNWSKVSTKSGKSNKSNSNTSGSPTSSNPSSKKSKKSNKSNSNTSGSPTSKTGSNHNRSMSNTSGSPTSSNPSTDKKSGKSNKSKSNTSGSPTSKTGSTKSSKKSGKSNKSGSNTSGSPSSGSNDGKC